MIGTLTVGEIEDVLRTQVLARVGCIVEGRPYIVPITYVYDGERGCVYMHCAEGAKTRAMRAHPEVCFEVEDIRDMANWRTVVARARFEEIWKDGDGHALELMASRLAPTVTSETALRARREREHREHGAARPLLCRLELLERSGRYERT